MGEERKGMVLTLTEFDVRAAREELGEDPKEVASHLQTLKDWLHQQKHFKTCEDDDFLLMFLRQAKYSQMRAREVLERYTKNRTVAPLCELYTNQPLIPPKTLEMLRAGLCFPLPVVPKSGVRVLMYRPGVVDHAKFSMEDTFRVGLLAIDICLLDPVAQVHGMQHVCDYTEIGMSHFTMMTPTLIKMAATVFLGTLPLRMQAAHFSRAPSVLSGMLSIMKAFLGNKLSTRLHNHWSNLDSLHAVIPKTCLPNELGGSAGTCAELANQFVEHVQKNVHRAERFACLEYDESKKPSDDGAPTGAFRKLNVD